MRNLILFLAIVTVCGSLTKTPIVHPPCGNQLVVKAYNKKRKVWSNVFSDGNLWIKSYGNPVLTNIPYNDSITISIYIPHKQIKITSRW